MKSQKSRDLQIAGVFMAVLLALPLLVGDSRYLLSVLMNCMGLSLIALGVWLTFTIGRINICQAGFALIGGYATAIFLTRFGLSFWLALPLSALVAGALGALIGSFIL
ncbi:MAG: hypothetical protein RL459_820, partial [Pseudomonadota bacterium]